MSGVGFVGEDERLMEQKKQMSRRGLVMAAVFLAWVLAVSPMPAAGASQTDLPALDPPIPSTARGAKTIAPGVTYQMIANKEISSRAYILRFDPLGGSSLKPVPADLRLPATSSTVPMLQNEHAVAGINGDFLSTPRRSPLHAFATDGDLLQTRVSGVNDKLLGITGPGVVPRLGTTQMQIALDDPTHLAHWPIDSWNPGVPSKPSLKPDEVAGFTTYGGSSAIPPGDACSARLIDPSGPRWLDAGQSGITRSYTVKKVACTTAPMALKGGTVLSALKSGSRTAQVLALTPGTTVSITWSLQGWSGVTGVIGGNPLILDNGVNTVDPKCMNYLCIRNARTGVGQTANGTIILVVIDMGPGSDGLTLYNFAEFLRSLGAVNALNLDGDGSSTMWVKGETVNQPGDPGRKVSCALAILRGPDPDLHIDPPI